MNTTKKLLIAILMTSTLVAVGVSAGLQNSNFKLVEAIAFSSTRDNPGGPVESIGEIYLMNTDGTSPRRLTDNGYLDVFPTLSPDGKKIVFDSNRNRAEGESIWTSDLFVMDTDGTELGHLIRGSSATWSPDGKFIAFHASASGTGVPIRMNPGSATTDSDIFVMNVDDAGVAEARNITNSQEGIDDDPAWSPDGQLIVFTSHPTTDDPQISDEAEIFVIGVDGTGRRLTFNTTEERGPSWSPDGTRIVFGCRIGTGQIPGNRFEICVMNADGTGSVQRLTFNTMFEGTPTFSPDGTQIVFSRALGAGRGQEIFVMNADGTNQVQLTDTDGINFLPNWGMLRVRVPKH